MRMEVPTCLVASRLLSSLGTLASPASRVRSYLGCRGHLWYHGPPPQAGGRGGETPYTSPILKLGIPSYKLEKTKVYHFDWFS